MTNQNSKSIRTLYYYLIAMFICTFGALSCGGGDQAQVGGIIGTVSFNTQACVPQQKIINFRNSDTQNPQRVMGVSFELGTNDQNKYKIDKVVVGNTEYQPSANLAQNVLIPAGGIMSVYTTYKTTKVTGSSNDTSYLDLFLNGPKLGILQIRMNGQAPTAKEGCGEGETMTFTVNKATMEISMPGSSFDGFKNEVTATGNFVFLVAGDGSATIDKDGFPKLTFVSEALRSTPVNSNQLEIKLDNDTFTGTFTDNKLSIDHLKLNALLPIDGVTLKSEDLAITGDNGASLTLHGSALTDSGDMKVVIGVKVQGFNAALDGAAIGVTFELKKQN